MINQLITRLIQMPLIDSLGAGDDTEYLPSCYLIRDVHVDEVSGVLLGCAIHLQVEYEQPEPGS